ncbi:hypothetical protein ACOSQ4_015839 [Xanthoceras sorbifolium]
MLDTELSAVIIFLSVIIFLRLFLSLRSCSEGANAGSSSSNPQDTKCRGISINKVLEEIDKPIQFSSQQLRTATDNFSQFLGSGGFGAVYKGKLSIGLLVAVKVLHGSSDRKIEKQELQALVYEYVENSSLDRLLFRRDKTMDWEILHSIAVGTAKGIAYLHEDCQQRIVHYDIKPENILLDVDFCPKIADFGLAKLCNREKTHITLTGSRGTPGYAAPEMWMPFPINHKCDVYSYGMLLFEVLGKRRNMDVNLPESQEWFPKWYQQEARPCMSVVVKMLEGGVDIPTPSNPFLHLMRGSLHPELLAKANNVTWTTMSTVTIIVIVVIIIKIVILVIICKKKARIGTGTVAPDTRCLTLNVDKFLTDMEREKPIRFTSQQLEMATENFTDLVGSGAFGAVYKGIFSNGTIVAVKVLHGCSDKRIEEQFMAEVSTIGRIHHFNLVRLYGFCFDKKLRALVYEYMENGSLDKYLLSENDVLGFEKLHEIAVGTARGIAYLHEECQQRIIHYDIKPENILLDENFFPKVADFGLAKLCNRENTHISMTGRRGTPGYAAPELWAPFHVTHKCDVHSFGMLLLEIVGRRRNMKHDVPESQEWFPKWVWKRFENGDLNELMKAIEIEAESDREKAERMIKVAFWCVQYKPESRPVMSVVVKMLEGAVEIPAPLFNQLQHILMESPSPHHQPSACKKWKGSTFDCLGSPVLARSPFICATPIMRKYEIEMVPN